MRFREAAENDAQAIAELHAESWRANYRGAYRDEFLDGPVFADRIEVWTSRLAASAQNQFVVVAEEDGRIVGFACAYGGQDEQWGSFLDNIHVLRDRQGRGIGASLVVEVARWCEANYPGCGLHLHVLEQNAGAQRFYERLGAKDRGGGRVEPAGGGLVSFRRYAWTTLNQVRA